MNQKSHPDRSPEASSVREELSHDEQAIMALDALAREEQTDLDVPPVPDDLREQWQERYGEARKAVVKEKTSWLNKLSNLWMYGGAAAVAAIAILLVINQSGTDPINNNGNPTFRGDSDFVPHEDTVTVYIASESISFQAMSETRNEGQTLEARDFDDAMRIIEDQKLDSAIIVDGNSGKFRTWNGKLGDEIQLPKSADAYDLSEALDDFLNP